MLVSWNCTNACNLSCPHCSRDAGQAAPRELSFQEGQRLIDGAAQAGFRLFIFSGGEALLRPDLPELVRYAAFRGMRPVLGSNGTLLDEPLARTLQKAGLARAGLSLDSVRPKAHDLFRGVDGAWDATVAACRRCAALGLSFQVHMTLLDWNVSELPAMHDLALGLGAAALHLFFPVRTGRGRDVRGIVESPEVYRTLLEEIAVLAAKGALDVKAVCAPQITTLLPPERRSGKGCLAGKSYCVVTPSGEVRPCAYLDQVAGNVLDTSFEDLWRDASLFRAMRTPEYPGGCGDCSWSELCGGCRARAFAESGNAQGRDPLCWMPL